MGVAVAYSWGAPPAAPADTGVRVTYGVDEPGERADGQQGNDETGSE